MDFINEYGYSNVPKDQGELGRSVRKKSLFRKCRLKEFRINLLNQIDNCIQNPLEKFLEENIKLINAYVQEHVHSKSPITSKIGKWVVKQRQRYVKNLLNEERVKILENLPGWTWNKREDRAVRED